MSKSLRIFSSDYALRYVASFMFSVMLIYGFYVQIHGDYSPGGGFQGGVIIASAIILYSMIFDDTRVRVSLPDLGMLGAVGLFIYGGTGIFSIFFGGRFLSYLFMVCSAITGQKVGIFIVEIGVGLTVCASVMSVYFDFASLKNDINSCS
ncbi:Na(+)/H(+) antiporter subunit B [Candidatus Anaplasma sp. TIGMIC]|uniref:Na(+)/H(+) antiporter subunit B n=1 Tax=Candidatus Anaplasma sp. TIGMIC TaxID=3020713 RepID=UPI00232DE5B2|nr:Na(+)/H(+) antiporter subunit B [Candidatus Anaplasma sp. TIGMIC]MDB1135021.1 Na(+)/H(+) antiporter subunit B [Candidatus Anaplasma sp. TIGMIC]